MRRLLLFGLAALVLAACPAAADEILLMDSGLTLVVTEWRIDGDLLILSFPEDGLAVAPASALVEAHQVEGVPVTVTWQRDPQPQPAQPTVPVALAQEEPRGTTTSPARPRPVLAVLQAGETPEHHPAR